MLEQAHPPEAIATVIGNAFLESLTGECIDDIVAEYGNGVRVVLLRSQVGAKGRPPPAGTEFAHS